MARIVITGGPGAGKTTLLLALQARGYTIVGDTARTIIQDRVTRGLSPRPIAHEMTQETRRIDIDNYARHAATSDTVFFDRGVVSGLYSLSGNESELQGWLSRYPYFHKVFLLPPWKEIYTTDAERDHTFEHAEWVYQVERAWYRRCGYQILEVPKVSVADRCEYVLQVLASSDA